MLMQYSKCEQTKTNQIIWTSLHSKYMIFGQKMLFGCYYCIFYIHGHRFKWDNLYYIRIVLWIFHFFISWFVNDNSSKFIALFTSQNFRIIYNTSRLGFSLFLVPNQKTYILSFLKRSFLPFLLTVPVFNEMFIETSKQVRLPEKQCG
jgi:predicted neutral ceramidase superfamily lipid hydrolase